MESQNLIGQFRVPKPSLSKWGQVYNLSRGNEFYLHENIILISKAEHLTSFSYRGSGNSEMAYWLTGASLRNLLNLVLVNFPASTLPARAFICRWFNEPLSGYLRTSFSPSVSIKSSVFQRNRRISRIVLRGNTTERARATTTKTKETRTYKKQQVSNQSRFPKVTVCFDRCKKFTYLKNEDVFTQNVFLVHQQTILEVNEIFVQFLYLSSHRNDLCWNRFPVPKRRLTQNGQF